MSLPATLDVTLERLSPEARRLLWILGQAVEMPVPQTLVEKVFSGESVEDERLRQIGRMMAAFERLPPSSRPETPPMPEELRTRIGRLLETEGEAQVDVEPFIGELVEQRLVTRAPLIEGGQAMGLSCSNESADAVARFMQAHPDERKDDRESTFRSAFGERYGAAFVAAVEGKVPGGTTEAAIEAGTQAVKYFIAAGATEKLAELFGEAVRAAKDASIVGPVAFVVEQAGALDALLAAFGKKNDTLGEAGTLAALAGHRKDSGDVAKAIELELRSLGPLARLDNVVPRAIVHLRLAGLLELVTRAEESAAHLAAALLYRALAGVDFAAELRLLVAKLGRDRSYALPSVSALVADPAFGDLARFVERRGASVQDLQADLDALVAQVKQHIGH